MVFNSVVFENNSMVLPPDGALSLLTAATSVALGCPVSPVPSPQVQSEDSVLLFVAAWTVTEIIRYSFYTFSLLNHLPYLIKWAR